jgi:hypothetical protein
MKTLRQFNEMVKKTNEQPKCEYIINTGQLPNEMLYEISKYLEGQDLINLSVTNKDMYNMLYKRLPYAIIRTKVERSINYNV